MYAIVDIAGQQFKVEKNNKVFVHRLANEEGSKVNFDKVLLIDNEGKILVGEPVIEGACIVAKVVSHCKGDKVLVFKKKRRKGYQVMNGHRQYFTEVVIEDILEKGYKAENKPVEKKTAKPETTKEKIAAKTETTKEEIAETKTEKAAPKKDIAKKTATTKAAPKTATTKKAAPKTTVQKKSTTKTEPKKTVKKADKKEE